LIEATVALVIILVALLGVFISITYAISYNAGNKNRTKTLAVLQEQVERLRSAKFTPTQTDFPLRGTSSSGITQTITRDNMFYNITTIVDNDPSTTAIESETDKPDTSIKEIKITAVMADPSPGWQTAVPATVVLRRVRAN